MGAPRKREGREVEVKTKQHRHKQRPPQRPAEAGNRNIRGKKTTTDNIGRRTHRETIHQTDKHHQGQGNSKGQEPAAARANREQQSNNNQDLMQRLEDIERRMRRLDKIKCWVTKNGQLIKEGRDTEQRSSTTLPRGNNCRVTTDWTGGRGSPSTRGTRQLQRTVKGPA